MRFKELRIREAGPLKDKKIDFHDVNLIVGNNEEGKTTLVDILIQALFGRKNPYIKGLWNERFDFDGRADAETEGDPLSPEEMKFASLFIIREGDMKWQGKSAGKREMLSKDMWNDDIREVLYGSDEVYSRINKKAVELMGVSQGKGWMTKLLSNLQELETVIDRETGRAEEYKNNETLIAAARKKLDAAVKERDEMTEARKVSASLAGRNLIENFFQKTDDLEKTSRVLGDLRKTDLESIRREWEALEKSLGAIDREIAGFDIGIASRETEKKEKNTALLSLKNKTEELRSALLELEMERKTKSNEINTFEKYSSRERENITGKSFQTFRAALSVLSAVFLSLAGAAGTLAALLALEVLPWQMSLIIPAAVGGPCLIAGFVFLLAGMARSKRVRRSLAELDARQEAFFRESRSSSENLEREIARTNKMIDDFRREARELSDAIAGIESGTGTVELENRKKERGSMAARIDELRRAHHSLGDISRQLEKQDTLSEKHVVLSQELRAVSDKLKKKFGTDSASFLKEELKKLIGETGGREQENNYNEQHFTKLLADIDQAAGEISYKQRENERIKAEVLTKTGEALKDLSKDVKKELFDAFYSDAAALGLNGDLFNIYALRGRVRELTGRVREDIRLGELFMKTLDRVQSDTGALVDGVLRTDEFRSAVGKLTNGNYVSVGVRDEDGDFRFTLENAGGEIFAFSSLSTGTRNQVYFAVRLALARSLFRGQKGVFILDDAFLSFDEERRRSAAELLAQYASEGWQIVYSSVNEKNMQSVFEKVFGGKLNKIVL